MLVAPWLDAAVDEVFAFVEADFIPVSCRYFLLSFGELLEFFFAASHASLGIDIVSEPEFAKRSSSDGRGRVKVSRKDMISFHHSSRQLSSN